MIPFPKGKFGVIYADPPWLYKTYSDKGRDRSPDKHYAQMKLADIKALPVGDLAAKDCVLFLWVTWPLLLAGLETITAWGFTYKTCGFAWMKVGVPGGKRAGEVIMINGHWTRGNSEVCLLATRGRPKRLSKSVYQAILAPRTGHSVKPAIVRDRIEALVNGPYIELFARERAPGWEVWGDQLP